MRRKLLLGSLTLAAVLLAAALPSCLPPPEKGKGHAPTHGDGLTPGDVTPFPSPKPLPSPKPHFPPATPAPTQDRGPTARFERPSSTPRPPSSLPSFPWPPPAASASVEISRQLLAPPGVNPSLADVSNRLVDAFNTAGYGEKSFYAVPDGFVMVSRLEQITGDGSPAGSHRWSLEIPAYTQFSVTAYLRALFTAQVGHYRVICFTVTPHPFPESDQRVTDAEALAWLSHGLNALPNDVGAAVYTNDFRCTALVYEFVKAPGGEPTLALPPGSLGAEAHLRGSGIKMALENASPH